MAASNGKLYAIAGSSLPYVEEYDPATNTWTTKANLPNSRDAFGITEVDGKIYVIGGTGTASIATMVHEYDPTTNAWSQKANMPTPRYYVKAVAVNGKIYALGGNLTTTGTPKTATVEEYDPTTNTWISKTNMPTLRGYFSISQVNGKIYVFGGQDVNGTQLNIVEEYDPETDTWISKGTMPTARSHNSAVSVDNKIYVIAGGTSPILKSVDVYDPTNDSWSTISSLNVARNSFGAAVLNGKIYVAGGSGTSTLSSVEEYTTPTPNQPMNLTAAGGNAIVTLSWGSSEGATSYNIKRSTTAGGPYTTIATGVTGTTYTDTIVTNGTTYYYVITAVNAGVESANSNEASAIPQAPASTGRAILTITPMNGIEKEYDLSMAEVNAFTAWYDAKADGTGPARYTLDDPHAKGPFKARKDNIIFDKIITFDIDEYTPEN